MRRSKLVHHSRYLGHRLTKEGYSPSVANLEVIENFPAPKGAKEVKRFLGLGSYFRRFIENFASLASPLNRLLKKDVAFTWSEHENQAFQQLKYKLIHPPILRPPDYTREFHLFTDASAEAYGAVLMQASAHISILHAVAYASKSLSEAEKRFSATHAELAAQFSGQSFTTQKSWPIPIIGPLLSSLENRPPMRS